MLEKQEEGGSKQQEMVETHLALGKTGWYAGLSCCSLLYIEAIGCIYLLKEAMVVHLNHDWRKKKIKSTLINGNNLSPYYMCQVQQ